MKYDSSELSKNHYRENSAHLIKLKRQDRRQGVRWRNTLV